jgi:hypothetical protein
LHFGETNLVTFFKSGCGPGPDYSKSKRGLAEIEAQNFWQQNNELSPQFIVEIHQLINPKCF